MADNGTFFNFYFCLFIYFLSKAGSRTSIFKRLSVEGGNAAKTIVWTQSCRCVFRETESQRFENALVWTGP